MLGAPYQCLVSRIGKTVPIQNGANAQNLHANYTTPPLSTSMLKGLSANIKLQ